MKSMRLIPLLAFVLIAVAVTFVPAEKVAAFSRALALNEATFTEAIPLATRTTSDSSAGIDLNDYDGYIAITLLSEAASNGSSPTLNVKLQESSDNGSSDAWADVTGETWTEVTDAADAYQTRVIQSNALERYVRLHWTIGGTSTPTFAFGASMVGYKDSQ